MKPEDVKEFFGGPALNRSMQGITIYLDLRFGGDDSDEDEISDKIDEDEKDEINSFIKQIFEAQCKVLGIDQTQ
jgi:hypothetical protein